MSFLRKYPVSNPGAATDSDDDLPAGLGRSAPSSLGRIRSGGSNAMALNGMDLRALAGGLMSRFEGDGASPFSQMKVLRCRGTTPGLNSKPTRAPPGCAVLGCPPGCQCDQCPECDANNAVADRRKSRRGNRGLDTLVSRPSLRDPSIMLGGMPTDGHGGSFGGIGPSSQYIKASKVPSVEQPSDHPLVVISIEAVLCAKLPPHLSGGHTNVLSRMYLDTFFDYLLHPGNRWSLCFWTGSMKRKEAMEVLRMLKLPTGSPETDERDGVLGLWSREDCKSGYDGGEMTTKDLEILWKELEDEEGIRWSQEDTVVITDFPKYMSAQPNNFIIAPSYHYKMVQPAYEDQYLLMMIAALEELTTQSNFSQYIKSQSWHVEDSWMGTTSALEAERDKLVHEAVRVCAKQRILIKGGGGN